MLLRSPSLRQQHTTTPRSTLHSIQFLHASGLRGNPVFCFQVLFISESATCTRGHSMGKLDHASAQEVSVDSEERSSQDSKLEFSEDEEELIARMYNLIGERWSLIAGRIPGRSAEEIERYCTIRYFSGSE